MRLANRPGARYTDRPDCSSSNVTATSARSPKGETLPILNFSDKAEADEMVMVFVTAFATVALREFNSTVDNILYRADMHTVGTNNFHVLRNLASVVRIPIPPLVSSGCCPLSKLCRRSELGGRAPYDAEIFPAMSANTSSATTVNPFRTTTMPAGSMNTNHGVPPVR